MYATRLLSDLQKNPELLAASPDGPNSGYLVIQDEESMKAQSCLSWCLMRSKFHEKLPFPQDKEVHVEYNDDGKYVRYEPVFFIPVLNRPLSHNCYYALVPHGKHKGKAFTGSSEKNTATRPAPLDPQNLYQQFKIFQFGSQILFSSDHVFEAATLARDGFVPLRLRCRENWEISFKTPDNNNLKLDATAKGLDPTLRARLPEFEQQVVVGKWYSPYTFVKEGTVSEQVARSMYNEVTLEQRWERIDDDKNRNGARVAMNSVQVFVGGRKARLDEKSESGVFRYTSDGEKKTSVGLRKEVVERMKWEQERGGWLDECVKGVDWSEFGCYVLVERFNFRRMDGSLVMSFDFKHFNQIRTCCESCDSE